METRRLGNSDLRFTTLGLGTWALGGGDWKFGWGPQDEQDAIAAIHAALDAGINWIDTAPVYGGGQAETLVGRALAARRSTSPVYVATKCGRILEGRDNVFGRLTRASVLQECEESLRRLGIEAIDLYQIHWPDPVAEIEEAWQAMVDLVKQGKVRHLGVSNHQVEHMERLRPLHPITSLQPPYSLVARDAEKELLPYCQRHQIGVIAYSPLGKGLLTSQINAERMRQLDPTDHRHRDPRFQPPQLEINVAFVDGLQKIAQRSGRSSGELAIAWVLRRPEITAAIVGARRPAQIQQTSRASDWQLDADTLSEIDQLLTTRDRALAELGNAPAARV